MSQMSQQAMPDISEDGDGLAGESQELQEFRPSSSASEDFGDVGEQFQSQENFSGEEEEEDVHGDPHNADAERSNASGFPIADRLDESQEQEQVQRKLEIFGCESIRASIDKVWSMLPVGEQGELSMNGYVECHLRLQKCLSKDFDIERSIASAIDDWDEDVPDGQEAMSPEEFSMFLFELCSLWCGPRVSLQLYLLFLNAVFISITDAAGSHTVGLKPLQEVQRLPRAFFDLLTSQGWNKPKGNDEDEDYDTWHAKNLSPESQQLALEQAPSRVVCQYGKLGPDSFGLHFEYPLNTIQAFGISLTTLLWS